MCGAPAGGRCSAAAKGAGSAAGAAAGGDAVAKPPPGSRGAHRRGRHEPVRVSLCGDFPLYLRVLFLPRSAALRGEAPRRKEPLLWTGSMRLSQGRRRSRTEQPGKVVVRICCSEARRQARSPGLGVMESL